mmetsp:Transcript_6988/g.10208  ORF Transcript_6988/g.10208 Transcript_6988/m.10208 type:complete len:547 (+) Transcript_6988:93-1733(+)
MTELQGSKPDSVKTQRMSDDHSNQPAAQPTRNDTSSENPRAASSSKGVGSSSAPSGGPASESTKRESKPKSPSPVESATDSSQRVQPAKRKASTLTPQATTLQLEHRKPVNSSKVPAKPVNGTKSSGKPTQFPRGVSLIGTPGPGKPVRYGVRLRFGQIQVRVGSRFATMEGADAVARAFRATVSFGRDNGEASLNEAKLVEYSKEFVECFTKYNNIRERVSITSVIRQWLKTWTIRGQQKRKRKMVEQTRKEKNLRAAQELTRAQMNAFQNANMGQRIIGAVDFGNNHMHQQNQLPNSGMAPQHSFPQLMTQMQGGYYGALPMGSRQFTQPRQPLQLQRQPMHMQGQQTAPFHEAQHASPPQFQHIQQFPYMASQQTGAPWWGATAARTPSMASIPGQPLMHRQPQAGAPSHMQQPQQQQPQQQQQQQPQQQQQQQQPLIPQHQPQQQNGSYLHPQMLPSATGQPMQPQKFQPSTLPLGQLNQGSRQWVNQQWPSQGVGQAPVTHGSVPFRGQFELQTQYSSGQAPQDGTSHFSAHGLVSQTRQS